MRLAPGVAMIALALIPVIAAVVMFPGDGPMPYPVTDWVWEMVVAGIVAVLAGRHCPALTAGAVMWAVVATGAVAIPSAMGGNIGRIEDVAALPLAVGLAWQRPLLRDRLIVAAAAVALALSEWTPAVGAITVAPGLASTHRAFYAPLNGELAALASNAPAGRVEVVPTEYHWEAAYVAPVIPLARGWERQLDTADNPIFYQPGLLYPASYRAWLLDNGVRFVALAHAPLDFAAVAEAQLISSGAVPGLKQVWADSTWTLYKVSGATGIVSGPARLVRASADSIAVDVTGTGDVTIRVRFSPDWTVSGGSGCVTEVQGSWIGLRAVRPGLVTLRLSLLDPGASACR